MCKFVYLCVLGSACVYLKLCQRAPPALLCRGASSANSASSIIPLRRCLIRISKTCAEYNVIRYTNAHTDSRDRRTDILLLAKTRRSFSLALSLALVHSVSRSRARFSKNVCSLSLVLALASRKTHTRAR